MAPTVQAVVTSENALEARPQTWAEDFSFYQREIPGLYLYLGVRTPGAKPEHLATAAESPVRTGLAPDRH